MDPVEDDSPVDTPLEIETTEVAAPKVIASVAKEVVSEAPLRSQVFEVA
jgi:hypothetical protein